MQCFNWALTRAAGHTSPEAAQDAVPVDGAAERPLCPLTLARNILSKPKFSPCWNLQDAVEQRCQE